MNIPVCCGQPMEIYRSPEPWGMFEFDYEDLVDAECLVCGKEIESIPV